MSGLTYGFIFLIGGILFLIWNKKNPAAEGVEYLDIQGYGLSIISIISGVYVIIKESIKLLK